MKKWNLFIIVFISLVLSGCSKSVDFTKTNTVTFHNLTVEIPTVFVSDDENSNENIIFYSYTDANNYNSCMLYLNISDYPKNDMKEVIQQGLLGKTDFEYSERNINGYRWSVGYREGSAKYNQTFYAINNNGKQYSINYDDFGSGEECAKALTVIENSLKFN